MFVCLRYKNGDIEVYLANYILLSMPGASRSLPVLFIILLSMNFLGEALLLRYVEYKPFIGDVVVSIAFIATAGELHYRERPVSPK